MEAENTSSWSSEANWTVADGSLVNSVTFESSVSPIDEGAAVSILKSPLLLQPPSPDSGPCEITISFSQKHEVRQVYVRSTARVYEIYYAPNLHSSNEYLCTVRCSIAAKDEEKSKSNSNISTSEDDWVEVKVPDSPLLDSTNRSLPSGRSTQDFYEATAEMTDVDPCISLTLRLLSLHNKGCVFVDEVYVFAEPVESADLENQVGHVVNSAGNSLMAMLVPTILHLSKTRNSQIQDKCTFDTREKQKFQEIGSKSTESTNIASTIQREVKLQELNGATVEPSHLQIPIQVPDTENRPESFAKEKDFPISHIERALDQLCSRVGRIEELCLRFEKSMLKPISSIEARLQQVEQQLEVLSKNSQYCGFPSGTRFSAPEFSCNESGSNSFCNDGSEYPSGAALESDRKDICSVKLSIPPDDMSISVNEIQLLPSLLVAAPEFSNGDDEEDIEASKPVMESPREKSKPAVSIHDALASALAGLLASTSVQPQYMQALAVKAPQFLNDEDDNNDKLASPRAQCEIAIDPLICLDKTDGVDCIKDSVLTSCSDSSLESDRKVMRCLNDSLFEERAEGVDEGSRIYGEEEDNVQGTNVDYVVDPAEPDVARTDVYQITEDTGDIKVGNGISEVPISDKADIPNHFLGNQAEDGSNTKQGGEVEIADITAPSEVTARGSSDDILQNVLEFSHASSVVDFETPILDVRFISQENSITKSPLEVLLADMAESNVEVPCVEKSDNSAATDQQSSLILVEDGEPTTGAATYNHHFVDFFEIEKMPSDMEGEKVQVCVDLDGYKIEKMPSNMVGEKVQDHFTCSSQQMFAASLI